MKNKALSTLLDLFKTWFLPQPPHDEQFPVSGNGVELNTARIAAESSDQAPAEDALESAADMERRAARKSDPAPAHLNLNNVDMSNMARPPEGSDDRASRAANPFSRTPSE